MGGKPRKQPLTTIDRVRAMAFERVESALAQGYRIDRSAWSYRFSSTDRFGSEVDDGTIGQCCAVGAIAFNGRQPPNEQSPGRVYAMAATQLMACGVEKPWVGVIIDAISDGFEGSALLRDYSSSRYCYCGELGYPLPDIRPEDIEPVTCFVREPYWRLGREIAKLHAGVDWDAERLLP
jgi:hypothetical protein